MALFVSMSRSDAFSCFKEEDSGAGGEGEFDRDNEKLADGKLDTNEEGVDISFL